MAKKVHGITDEQVEQEIARLLESEAVQLAKYEMRLKYRRRQYLYNLRDFEKKGKELMAAGITREMLDEIYHAEKMGEAGC
jgi:SOS response regulatory protein OraA/RecX